MAERVGFEPTLEFPLNTLSKRAPSATRPSLRRYQEATARNKTQAENLPLRFYGAGASIATCFYLNLFRRKLISTQADFDALVKRFSRQQSRTLGEFFGSGVSSF